MNLQHSPTAPGERPAVQTGSEIRLQRAWLVFARIAWVIAVGLFVVSLPSYYAYLHIPATSAYSAPQLLPSDVQVLHRLGLSLDFYAWFKISVYVIILLAFVLVGVVLFWRKSYDRLALLAALSLVLFPIAFSTEVVGTLPPAWTLPTECVEFLGNVCLGLFFLLFPSGRFVPRWTLWFAAVITFYWIFSNFFPDSPISNSWLFTLLFPGTVIGIIVLQVYRYRRVSTPLQRQQTKWVVFGIAFAFGPLVISLTLEYTLLSSLFSTSSLALALIQTPFDLLLLLFPLSLGFAILRNHLWDIDRLVNRTLVYSALTISLGLIYAGLVIGLQYLLRGLISQTNDIAIVASTLAIAALFQPLRRRIQQAIDRRFYRHKYDAARTLGAFSATLRNEVDLTTLKEHLVEVVQETMQPTSVSLWLRQSEPKKGPNKLEDF